MRKEGRGDAGPTYRITMADENMVGVMASLAPSDIHTVLVSVPRVSHTVISPPEGMLMSLRHRLMLYADGLTNISHHVAVPSVKTVMSSASKPPSAGVRVAKSAADCFVVREGCSGDGRTTLCMAMLFSATV